MRNTSEMKKLEELNILLQFLYMNEDNFVEIETVFDRKFKMVMNENFDFFEDGKRMSRSICDLVSIPSQLKEQPPENKNTELKSRWEEITWQVNASKALTKMNI